MKIVNTSELKDVITTLITPIDTPSTAISTKMDADEINEFFESIESSFNKLYEKLRLLQDLHDFTKEYIQSIYGKTTKELSEARLNSDIAEQEYRNSKVRASVAVFRDTTAVRDRDGSALYQADITNGIVIPGNAIVEEAEPSSSSSFAEELCYRRNHMPADNYKAFYVLEDAPSELPKEKVTFFLPLATTLNHIDVSAVNSDIENIELICSNGSSVNVPIGEITFAEKEIIAIEIELKANKRDRIMVEVSDKSSTFTDTDSKAVIDILDNVWDTYLAQKGDVLYVLH